MAYMGVEPKIGGVSPQIIHFNRVFHYKQSILGHPYFWKHPYIAKRGILNIPLQSVDFCPTVRDWLMVSLNSGQRGNRTSQII